MTDATQTAISANLHALQAIITQSAKSLEEGIAAIDNDKNRNGAIGAVLDLERGLESALALLRASLALHRHMPL